MGEEKSPVSGKAFEKLSDSYKKKKKAEGGTPKPNLEASGDMLDSLGYKVTSEGVKIGVFGKDAPKADGHNNLSGDSLLPERRFLPDEGEFFKKDIREGIESIIADAVAEEGPDKAMFEDVESKAELYSTLQDLFIGLSKSEIRNAVLYNEDWYDMLDDLDLLRWL